MKKLRSYSKAHVQLFYLNRTIFAQRAKLETYEIRKIQCFFLMTWTKKNQFSFFYPKK